MKFYIRIRPARAFWGIESVQLLDQYRLWRWLVRSMWCDTYNLDVTDGSNLSDCQKMQNLDHLN